MLGLLITVLFSIGAAGVGWFVLRRLTADLDHALAFGAHGLAGLAILGMLTFPIALLPGGTSWGVYVMGFVALAGYVPLWQGRPRFKLPLGGLLLVPLAALLAGFCSLVGVLSPSDSFDWDTLAYHLAVPKMWIRDGQMHYVSFIHQSNFPLTVDGLYIWGLDWGGQAGGKAFSLCFAIYGAIALFGFARQRYGGNAGWWALLAYVGIPMVAWEAGTAYIDVSNGLFVGLGILFAGYWALERQPDASNAKPLSTVRGVGDRSDSSPAQRGRPGGGDREGAPEALGEGDKADTQKSALLLSAIFLGFAAGSKYTGLQTIFAVAVVLAVAMALTAKGTSKTAPEPADSLAGTRGLGVDLRRVLLATVLALLIASPWYVRNVVNTGNPVFPFFYSVFKGRNWDAFSDVIYKDQQQTFGAGRAEGTPDHAYTSNPLEPARIGGSILGLAYQPGRYADPDPSLRLAPEPGGQNLIPMGGSGLGLVSLGAIPLAALLAWMFGGRLSRFEGVVAGAVLISLAMWFVLSEQSRYILGLMFPLCVLAGGAVTRLRIGPLIAGAMAIQFLSSVYVLTRYGDRFPEKLKVVMGSETEDEYVAHNVGFYAPAKDLNTMGAHRIGLFDEVFGYFLDVPYFWAGPGHSTEMGYEQMTNSDQLVDSFRRLGIDVIYINLGQSFGDRALIDRWMKAAGLSDQAKPYSAQERADAMGDPRNKYKVLLAEAVAAHKLQPVKQYGARMIFSVVP